MHLTTRGRYAVMAMADLATRQSAGCECGPVCLAEIAERQQLSLSYLEQLFAKLRRAGLVASARGPGGGYRLVTAPEAIPIAAIVAAVDEAIHATRCEGGSGGCMAGRQIELFLSGISLADVVGGRVRGRAVSVPASDALALAAE